MHLLFASMLMVGLAIDDAGDAAVLKRVKQVGKVYASWEGEGKNRHVARLDIRITGDRDAKEVAGALKELAKLPRLEAVMLLGPAFNDDAARELARLTTLRDVQLHATNVTNSGIQALADLPHLRRLAFAGRGLTDPGLKHVVRMKELQYLEITDAPITNAGLEALRGMTQLRRLAIVNSRATRAALQNLMDALPELESRTIDRLENK